MTIERTANEIILRLHTTTDAVSLERIVKYLKYKEAVLQSDANEDQANELANESKSNWWADNKARFIRQESRRVRKET